jgi:tRNA(adenine34) deaminase
LFLPSLIVKQWVSSFCFVFSVLIHSVFLPCVLCVSVLIILLSALILFPLFPHVILSPSMEADIQYMQEALAEARSAAATGEVPIGAVLVHEGQIVARSGNRTIRDCDPTAHAEIVALREAARFLGNYRLADTTLYVTIEPCSMCSGAILQARVPRLVYGADDPKGGAVRSCFEILSHPRLNHQVEVTSGVLAAECAAIIQSFFAARRE